MVPMQLLSSTLCTWALSTSKASSCLYTGKRDLSPAVMAEDQLQPAPPLCARWIWGRCGHPSLMQMSLCQLCLHLHSTTVI